MSEPNAAHIYINIIANQKSMRMEKNAFIVESLILWVNIPFTSGITGDMVPFILTGETVNGQFEG